MSERLHFKMIQIQRINSQIYDVMNTKIRSIHKLIFVKTKFSDNQSFVLIVMFISCSRANIKTKVNNFTCQLLTPIKLFVQDTYLSLYKNIKMSDIQGFPEEESTFFSLSMFTFFCFCIGAIRLIHFFARLLSPYFIRRKNLIQRYGGGWALVTGGSEGIGLAIAQELAKEGFSIVLVSRSKEKLQAASSHLKAINSKIQVQTQSMDFEKMKTAQDYSSAFQQILHKDISVLVNNVGFYVPNRFAHFSFQDLRREMKINCLPASILSRIFLEKMLKRKERSGVINISSGASLAYYIGSGDYSATKKFIDYLSQSVAYQCANKVDILTARPYVVTTTMTRNFKSFHTTTADKSAKSIVDSLGNTSICYGPFLHHFQGVGAEFTYGKVLTQMYNLTLSDFTKKYEASK